MTEKTLYGIPLQGYTETHGPCQVASCDLEWTVCITIEGQSLSLCNPHTQLFGELEKVGKFTLENYRAELE